MLDNLILGFTTIATIPAMTAIIVGVLIGILCGVLPGLSASTAVALMVPFTFGMDPVVSVLLLVSVYLAGEYGGSITAIAIGTPGTPAAAATMIDGYQLTKQGKPGLALTTSVVASSIGGMIGAIVLFAFSEPLATVALSFGAPEYFALAVFGLTIIASLASDNLMKGFIVMFIGLFLKSIGLDPFTGEERFTFGVPKLMDGLSFIPALIGLFAMASVFTGIEKTMTSTQGISLSFAMPRVRKLLGMWKVYLHASLLGSIIGVLPGAGATIASFICYNEVKRFSKNKDQFGKGCLEGVAAPEAGNNAVVGGSLVPLLTLGIPGSATAAVLLGALMLHDIQPGPLLFQTNGAVVYGIFAGLFVACLAQLFFGIIGVPVWVKVISAPKALLLPVIAAISVVGAYGYNNSIVDVWVMFGFGLLGYVLKKYHFPVTPIILALVLGGILEENFRRSLMMSEGEYGIFFAQPISASLLVLAALSLLSPIVLNRLAATEATKAEKKLKSA
ncbi:tripartite tricarboxylate transporter permease [Marinobacterium rhizophilum]|uniref:Tripartite tricarboxylate transporter permease n=1 Tax=Marinobacterium rhizophilum TaxID=420402 RepID=A0ABY5HGB3_9GAMM|nr:tripartite tricarboxylate transporter permease [Marinobacterium rhizophilum]UTW11397.1 tripartite tricarboxylate transporter permease [Marinobacterium rhizophilum]